MTLAPAADDLKARKVELVLQQLDSLPTLPAIAVRLLALTGNPESRIEEIVSLLSADQSLAGKVLSLVGSAAVGGIRGGGAAGAGGGITSIHQAAVLLGFETLRNLTLSLKVFEIFQHDDGVAEDIDEAPAERIFNRTEFWKHSLGVATAAELLAARARPEGGGGRGISPSDAFTCGLLHDVGKVAFDTAMPKSFARVVEAAILTRGDVADVERRVIGLDHALAGKRLAEAWNLPPLLTETIWLHGAPPPAAMASVAGASSKPGGLVSSPMILLVGLADLIVRRQHIGFSGNFLFPFEPEQYARPLGLTAEDLAHVTAALTDALEQRARAIGLPTLESRQLYLQSIANANLELGRVNQQLAQQNRKLAARSGCFDLMARFYQRITPAAGPGQLLGEIGKVAHEFFNSPRLVLFSQAPSSALAGSGGSGDSGGAGDFTTGEVVLFDAGQAAHESFLMAAPRAAGDQRAGGERQSFTRPASPQLDWLLERAQAFLTAGGDSAEGEGTGGALPRNCWFMPLLCGTEPVGGIVWVGQAGEKRAPFGGVPDLPLVSQAWGMTLRTAQIREHQAALTESLAGANRELGAMQHQLVRAKSLAGVGEMAAGAAHEMNNPLAIMCGRAQLLASRLTDPALKQDAGIIAAQGERLSQIITDMMDFARPQPPRLAEVNVAAVVGDAIRWAGERAGSGAPAVEVHLDENLPGLRADARQVQAALGEVILNAQQACGVARDGGDGPVAGVPPVQVRVRHDALDGQLIFQVADHGGGMSQEILRNAFAPFFSAKAAGRNRGMGLAKALRWIENHGGTIRLDSEMKRGTVAIILLPLKAGE